jgi:CTP:molybdopterin cytidylyltransferase MocA
VKFGAANTFGAVIVAAGLSSRMGTFKPLLPLGNSTFIEQVITTLREAGAEDIAVVTGRDAALIEQALSHYPVTFIHNKDYAVTDMFHSASLGLGFMADRVDCIFFTPVDVPLFGAATVRLLAERIQTSGDHIITPVHQGKNGHPLAIRSSAVPALIGTKNDKGLRGAIDAYQGPTSFMDMEDPGVIRDVDTPEDYQNLIRLARSPGPSFPA